MAEKRSQSELEKLRATAKLAGVDVDALLKEITESVLSQVKLPDAEALIHKVTAKVESDFAVKLANALEGIKKLPSESPVDIKGVVEGVVAVLEPKVLAYTQKTIENTFQDPENRKQIAGFVIQELEVSAAAAAPVDATPTSGNGRPGMGLSDILQHLPTIMDAWSKLRPQTSMVEDLGTILKWHSVLSRFEKSGGNYEEVQKAITDLQPK